jgi:hypothetical protein
MTDERERLREADDCSIALDAIFAAWADHYDVEVPDEAWDELAAALAHDRPSGSGLNNLPPATCYRTHTQPDENRGVYGAVWLADVKRALFGSSDPKPPRAGTDYSQLPPPEAYRLGYDSGYLDAEKVWLERCGDQQASE